MQLQVNSINLAIRFLLEIAGLVTLGFLGWSLSESWLRIGLALGIPIIAAAIWGTFAVPNDPSRSGNAPIPVPGVVRLVLELTFFALVVWSLFIVSQSTVAWIFGLIVCVHYAASYERLLWLLRQ